MPSLVQLIPKYYAMIYRSADVYPEWVASTLFLCYTYVSESGWNFIANISCRHSTQFLKNGRRIREVFDFQAIKPGKFYFPQWLHWPWMLWLQWVSSVWVNQCCALLIESMLWNYLCYLKSQYGGNEVWALWVLCSCWSTLADCSWWCMSFCCNGIRVMKLCIFPPIICWFKAWFLIAFLFVLLF